MVSLKLLAGIGLILAFVVAFDGVSKTEEAVKQGKKLKKQTDELISKFDKSKNVSQGNDRNMEDV